MKTLARTAAGLSFTAFFLSGSIVISQPGLFATVVGLFLIGIAFFTGPLLWLAAEKWCAKPDGR
ncbi:MAG TPA: hypothetical protein VGH19_05025 [Verrucomicrobiae bacterium]